MDKNLKRWGLCTYGLLCFVVLLSIKQPYAYSQNLICRVIKLNGFEHKGEVASMFLGPNTTDRAKTRIYITVA